MGNSTDLDAVSSTEIFRKDNPMILACARAQALLLPIRLDYVSGGYKAGTVLGKNSVSGNYGVYNDSASSGLNTAVAILFEAAEPASGGTDLARGIFKGNVFYDKLVGIDAAGVTDLKARTFADSTGVTLLTF